MDPNAIRQSESSPDGDDALLPDKLTGRQSDWRSILAEIGIRPSKALGQNFLHDRAIVRRIVAAADIAPDEMVVEVGPGLGVMTRELAVRATEVIAVELDRRLARHVLDLQLPHTTVVEADVLRIDPAQLTGRRPYLVVANLPYSVAAAAISHLLENDWRPTRLIVMVQREVAERIAARPPNMSLLSVAVQFFGTPRILFRIGRGAFVPVPKVESAVLRIDVHPEAPLDLSEQPTFFRLVRAGFGQRRKQLLNSIAAGLGMERRLVEQSLESAAIDPRRRAETLDVADWIRLFNSLQPDSADG